MQTYKIAVIAGDGIGPEVINEGIKVLNAVAEVDKSFKFDFTFFPWGCEYYKETGKMMAENGIENPEEIKGFNRLGYVFRDDLSSETEYVFERRL